jgi:hypothetical protein
MIKWGQFRLAKSEGIIESAEDLDSIEWVRRWKEGTGFRRFSWSSHGSKGHGLLMVERDDGSHWVVAYADGRIPGLPDWVES